MKKLFWFCCLISLHACSADHHVLKVSGLSLCIPQEYAIKVDESNIPSGKYDPEGGGYDISLIFDAKELAASIKGYQTTPLSPGIPGQQMMYVMLAESLESSKTDRIPQGASSLEATPQLIRLEQDAIAWQVCEKRASDCIHWGHCSDTFDNDHGFDCIRDFTTGSLTLSYVIHERNLALYPAIDDFLAAKIADWNCPP